MNDVCLDGAEGLVFDYNKDLLLFFQVDEVTKPGFFGKSVEKDRKKMFTLFCFYKRVLDLISSFVLPCCMNPFAYFPPSPEKWRTG